MGFTFPLRSYTGAMRQPSSPRSTIDPVASFQGGSRVARLRPVLILIVVAGLIFLISRNAAYFTGGPRPDPHTIRLSGSIEVTRIDLAARASGRVAAIPVTEGS